MVAGSTLLAVTLGLGAAPAVAQATGTVFRVVEIFDGSPGVFTSDGSVVCPSGKTSNVTSRTEFGGGRTLFNVQKTVTCNDGSGTFVLQIYAFSGFAGDGTFGPWFVRSGTGDYANLRGNGRVVGTPIPNGISDVYTGRLSLR